MHSSRRIAFFEQKYGFLLLAIVLLNAGGFSQAKYTTQPDYLKTKFESDNLLSDFRANFPDTSVSNLHNFFPRNFRGNYGLASPNYILNYRPKNIGFGFSPDPFVQDKFSESQVQYFRTKGPFADVAGTAGTNQLQLFRLIFTQTLKERFNITLRFNRYSSLGFYKRQKTFTNNFFLSNSYTNKKSKIGYYFYFLTNTNSSQENGGLLTDTLSAVTYTSTKSVVPIKISAAQRENKEYKLMFNPWLKLNSKPDSLNGLNSYLQIKSKFNFSTYEYKDTRSGTDQYYLLYYLDTAATYDSSRVMQFVNDLAYTLSKTDRSFGFTAGYRNEINRAFHYSDTLIMNNILFANLNLNRSLKRDTNGRSIFSLRNFTDAQYIFNGGFSGDYKLENRSEFFSEMLHSSAFLNLLAESRHPDYIYNTWYSNHFMWSNNFNPQQKLEAEFGLNWKKKVSISVFGQTINHYLFFDQIAYPSQLNGAIQNLGVRATLDFLFFRHLGVYVQNIFQSSSTQFISLPQEIVTGRLYFAGNFYKNNLQMNIGVQGQYYQSFYPYAYMPATQMFYLQDRRTTGTYPYLDAYLNVRIRPVTFFVKVENLLYKYAGSNYFLVPGYYQPDRAFRFGISWMFFD